VPAVVHAEFGPNPLYNADPSEGHHPRAQRCEVAEAVQYTLSRYNPRGASRCNACAIVAALREVGAVDRATLIRLLETPECRARLTQALCHGFFSDHRTSPTDLATPAFLPILIARLRELTAAEEQSQQTT
jgi:hypothetical protein